MNTSPTTTTTTCSLAIETGTEIVSSTGSELSSIALDAAEEANNEDDASAVNASAKAKTMKEVLMRCGRGLAVSIVIALAGKGFVGHAHNDPPGTDDVMMNVDLGIDNSKQVALLDDNRDGKNVANYDFTKVVGSGGMPSERSLQLIEYEFIEVGKGICENRFNLQFDNIRFTGLANVDACKAKCAACPGQGQAAAVNREFRGIYFFASLGCYCFLDDGDSFDKSMCTGATSAQATQIGTGAICRTGFGEGECWKVDSNLQCPGAPTKAPTNKPTTASPTNKPTTASPTSSPNNSKSAKVAKKVKSSKASEVNELGAAAANLQVQQMKSGGSSVSVSLPLVGILALIAFSNLLP